MHAQEMTTRELESYISVLTTDLSKIEEKAAKVRRELKDARDEHARKTRPKPNPCVSDHAALRFIERVHGIDVPSIKEQILSPVAVMAIESGASSVTIDGVKFRISGNTITTVIA